jgi:hypothetical protein
MTVSEPLHLRLELDPKREPIEGELLVEQRRRHILSAGSS